LGASVPIALRSVLTTVCVVARLPEFSSTSTRSSAVCSTVIFENVDTWSTPALVRESEANSSPSSRAIATQ
jgi:hypothetical protein